MSHTEFHRVEEEAQSKAGEKKAAASVEEMFAAQESEKGRPPYPHSLQLGYNFGMIAEAQARAECHDRQVLLTVHEENPAEVEMMERVPGLPPTASRQRAKALSMSSSSLARQ